jgi:glucan endo-1,3-alpha-glucosidase
MVCNRTYGGGTVEGYKKDIKDAQSVGLDGFALNVGGWDQNYKINTARLFQAAAELETDFRFFFSPDGCCGISKESVLDMISSYADHPNYFKYHNRPFLSAWGFGVAKLAKLTWLNVFLGPLKKSGHNMYFVPFLFTADFDVTPDYEKILKNYSLSWKYFMDGYFYFGATGLPSYKKPSLLRSAEAFSKIFHDSSKTFMANVSPYYWGQKQSGAGRRYFEFHGGEGIASQWESIIKKQKPEWVELVTWNDWDEGTYFSPMDDINKYWPWSSHKELGFYKTHRGFAELNKYYIEWYKEGSQPTINNDNIFFFYRTHPKDTIAKKDLKGPVKWRFGEVKDEIFVTTILKEKAELIVVTGGQETTFEVKSGITHNRVPFKPGEQYFQIKRNGRLVLNERGEDIHSSIDEYNFNLYSGFAHTD